MSFSDRSSHAWTAYSKLGKAINVEHEKSDYVLNDDQLENDDAVDNLVHEGDDNICDDGKANGHELGDDKRETERIHKKVLI